MHKLCRCADNISTMLTAITSISNEKPLEIPGRKGLVRRACVRVAPTRPMEEESALSRPSEQVGLPAASNTQERLQATPTIAQRVTRALSWCFGSFKNGFLVDSLLFLMACPPFYLPSG